jgi:hypothetical protein
MGDLIAVDFLKPKKPLRVAANPRRPRIQRTKAKIEERKRLAALRQQEHAIYTVVSWLASKDLMTASPADLIAYIRKSSSLKHDYTDPNIKAAQEYLNRFAAAWLEPT